MTVAIYSALLLLLVYYASPLQLADSRNGGVPKYTSIVQQENGDLQEPYGVYKRSRVGRDVAIAPFIRNSKPYVQPPITDKNYKKTTYANIANFVGTSSSPPYGTAKPKHIYIGDQPADDARLIQYAKDLKNAVKPTPKMDIWHNPTIYGLLDGTPKNEYEELIGLPPGAEHHLLNAWFYIIEGESSIVEATGPNRRNYDKVTDGRFKSAYIIVRPNQRAHLDVASIQPESRVNEGTGKFV